MTFCNLARLFMKCVGEKHQFRHAKKNTSRFQEHLLLDSDTFIYRKNRLHVHRLLSQFWRDRKCDRKKKKKKTFRHVVDVRECDTVGTIPVYSVSIARHLYTTFLYGGFSNWFQSFGQNYCGFWLAWLCRELNLAQKYASQGFQFFFHGSRRVSHFIWIKTRKVKTYACVPTRKP